MVKKKKLLKTSSNQDLAKDEGLEVTVLKPKKTDTEKEVEKPDEKEDFSGENKEKIDAILAVKEEKARLNRLEKAGTGTISDARVFQLMYLEKCAVEASLQIQVRKSSYLNRIEAIKQEMNGIIRQWEVTQKRSIRRISDVRREVEDDYGIVMTQWGYEEETGVLKRVQEELSTEEPSEKHQGEIGDKIEDGTKKDPDDSSG